jgi:two-component system, OmpR family, sensor histidine kinase CreC
VTRVLVTAGSAVALILFVAFIVARLLRSRSRGLSIRMQFFLALASIVGAFALGLGLLVLDRLEARTTNITEGTAREEAEAIAALVGSEMDARGVGLEDVARKYAAARGASVDAAGAEQGLSLLDPAGREVFAGGLGPGEPSTVSATAPVVVQGRGLGSVRVVKRTIVIRRALEDMAPFILVVSIVLGVTAAVAAAFIGRGVARPLEALTDFAVRVSEGERRAAPPPAFGREVQSLTFAIDSMRRQLEGRPFVETFAADLSHELKNPVAAIRASAEVLADGALDEPEEAARFVGRILEATTRIEGLLGDLLSLARIEARGVSQTSVLDLGELVEEAVERARERDGARVGVTAAPRFEVDCGASTGVRGDALWLGRLVDNLLDNARIHGAGDEPVRVAVVRSGDHVTLSVKNPGAIGRHVEKRLFRRFATTRADRGGTGLGLAIVRAIAEAHSGSAECATAGPPDVEFRISLPAA